MNKLLKICVIGNFGIKNKQNGGQVIKTIFTYNLLKENTDFSVSFVNTYKWFARPISLFIDVYRSLHENDLIILLTAKKGIRVFLPLLVKLRPRGTKLILSAVGGWLPDILKEYGKLLKEAKSFDRIWVETKKMSSQLFELGLRNVELIGNFKPLEPVPLETVEDFKNKRGFCIFSRITPIKGIDDAILSFKRLQSKYDVYLDIYGPIENSYKTYFFDSIKNVNNIRYCGVVSPSDSTKIISKYFMLLFPTRYEGEGVPATLIDAMFSGTPVLSSRYPNYQEILNSSNSITYEFLSQEDLIKQAKFCLEHKDLIYGLKSSCLQQASLYSGETISRKMQICISDIFK